MTILINIGFWALLIYAAVISFFAGKRYRKLRRYTFWIEQSLLDYRPETYIPVWRKQQRKKDSIKNNCPDQNYLQNPDISGSETTNLNKLLRNTLRY
jgi:hypothetical protein